MCLQEMGGQVGMDFSELKELMTLFEEGTIREFDLQKDDFHLYLSKNKQSTQQVVTTIDSIPNAVAPQLATEVTQVNEKPVVNEMAKGSTVDSPIVGVVYLSGSPGEAPFKAVGDTVKVGETLCIVEAMKIMNEIVSDVAGTITEILIDNEDVVEYGQPLFRIS